MTPSQTPKFPVTSTFKQPREVMHCKRVVPMMCGTHDGDNEVQRDGNHVLVLHTILSYNYV